MNDFPQNRRPLISQLLVSVFSFGLFVYFGYHLMHGNMGYFAWRGVEQKLASTQADYDHLHGERVALENRVKLLRPGSIDVDMLDEQARSVLGFVRMEERVVLTR